MADAEVLKEASKRERLHTPESFQEEKISRRQQTGTSTYGLMKAANYRSSGVFDAPRYKLALPEETTVPFYYWCCFCLDDTSVRRAGPLLNNATLRASSETQRVALVENA